MSPFLAGDTSYPIVSSLAPSFPSSSQCLPLSSAPPTPTTLSRHEDLELEYIPEITSRPLSLATRQPANPLTHPRPGETVELPCDASDADKFVRVWMKVPPPPASDPTQEDVMLFTGSIRLTENTRMSLGGPTNSTLMVSML